MLKFPIETCQRQTTESTEIILKFHIETCKRQTTEIILKFTNGNWPSTNDSKHSEVYPLKPTKGKQQKSFWSLSLKPSKGKQQKSCWCFPMKLAKGKQRNQQKSFWSFP
jgi:hypothetical protein